MHIFRETFNVYLYVSVFYNVFDPFRKKLQWLLLTSYKYELLSASLHNRKMLLSSKPCWASLHETTLPATEKHKA